MKRNRSFETHSGWGMALTLALYVAGVSLPLAFIICMAAGVAVEWIQHVWPATGTADVWDVIYTAIGGLFAVGWLFLF